MERVALLNTPFALQTLTQAIVIYYQGCSLNTLPSALYVGSSNQGLSVDFPPFFSFLVVVGGGMGNRTLCPTSGEEKESKAADYFMLQKDPFSLLFLIRN